MEIKESGEIATNIVRFFTLLLFSAGVLTGMGTSLLLNNGLAEAFIVAIVCVAVAFVFIWVKNNPRAFAKLMSICVFIASTFIGMGTILLSGKDGAIGITILLFVIVLVWGLWVFREKSK